ncbi:MAG: hypothetical protein GY749_13105 [Desulfobacteraceae bacterium]|nr:hypothetical protein [Desulfobacteraceae bacterium]
MLILIKPCEIKIYIVLLYIRTSIQRISSNQSSEIFVNDTLSKCRIVASLGVGYDRIDLDTATGNSIVVTNVPDYCIDEVSGMAITLILALGRRLFHIDRTVKEKQLNFVPPNRNGLAEITPVFRMHDQTLGIVGKIGTATALKAKGLGMKVIVYDPNVFGAVVISREFKPADFETLLRESDYICIHSSLNDETRNMFSYEQFKKMKPTSYLINTAGEKLWISLLLSALSRRASLPVQVLM